MTAAVASQWKNRRRRVFQSVFQTDISQPTPYSTPAATFLGQSQPFGGPAASNDHHYHHTRGAAASSAAFSPLQQKQHHPHPGHGLLHETEPSPAHSPTTSSQSTILAQSPPAQPRFPSLANTADDQIAYDRAWHVVTARIALPASATADDSFGTLAPESQQTPRGSVADADFYEAMNCLVNAKTMLPRATHTEDIVSWHAQQVRAHFAQHVIPLWAGCVDDQAVAPGVNRGNRYERHMIIVMSSIRTLEAALRLYFYGLELLMRGFGRAGEVSGSDKGTADVELLAARFRRDIHALVGISASEELMRSARLVLVRLVGTVLGMPSGDASDADTSLPARPSPPTEADVKAVAARQRLHQLVEQLHNVGLAGERFQVMFAEIMDMMMCDFVRGAYAGVWVVSDKPIFSTTPNTISRSAVSSSSSPCIISLADWVENHFARLSYEVLSRTSPNISSPVTLANVKTYQALALSRLAALRIAELFDIVLAWPSSRGALDDLRATITTSARRLQLTTSFSRALQTRLLHPGCSTLEILQTYIAIIRTLHALDHSKVLLGHVEPNLRLYLCQREDAIRIVVIGLLASAEEVRAARKATDMFKRLEKSQREGVKEPSRRTRADRAPFMTPAMPGGSSRTPNTRRRKENTPESGPRSRPVTPTSARPQVPTKLVELALLLNDPVQTRRAAPDEEDLDWNDMNWVPDPVDAGANYKRPKSEDVIGTLISALGSEDVFINEFTSIIAERLLGEPGRFDQELRVLDLLKRRFGEAALQNCDVMIKDVQDSRRLDAAIRRTRQQDGSDQRALSTPAGPASRPRENESASPAETQYHARILSRLFWPTLEREHFLLPRPIIEQQKEYEHDYESLKSGRKLTWLNQLGQTRVELELRDRTVTVDCTTVESTVIYAFQDPDPSSDSDTVRRSADELYNELQMDEDLIAAALSFWVSKGILRRVQHGVYAVAETLSTDPASAVGQAGASASAEESEPQEDSPRKPAKPAVDAKEQERRAIYWQYIRSMLTNSSASMTLGQMAMMMKMMIADGFPWSNEELQEFLSEKIAEGQLEVTGVKYRLVKK
ncbi:hypothetical protein B0T22DRAFT_101997 [Podospora appendiculata]|uniref:Anaphase-promoting complex subunit 2 n=1 Tax=Podospora appendiculata TaxID=314037 RepID=A0AAE0XLU6_9PEZI|nr:hypothetical protein B0T22DRAFT_101997 [Podospora appendiculata]